MNLVSEIWKAITGQYKREIEELKQKLIQEKKRHEEDWQSWRREFSEQNRLWEKLNYKLCDELEKQQIANSEKSFKIEQLKQELASCQQQLEASFLGSNEFMQN